MGVFEKELYICTVSLSWENHTSLNGKTPWQKLKLVEHLYLFNQMLLNSFGILRKKCGHEIMNILNVSEILKNK